MYYARVKTDENTPISLPRVEVSVSNSLYFFSLLVGYISLFIKTHSSLKMVASELRVFEQ